MSQSESALYFFARGREPAELEQQISSDSGEQVIVRQTRFHGESLQRDEPISGSLRHGNGYSAVQGHNGRRADLQQSVVKNNDAFPVSFSGRDGSPVAGRN